VPAPPLPAATQQASPAPQNKSWRARFQPPAANLFAARSWLPPPVVIRVEDPKAPPLPFLYLGKVLEEDGVVAFLKQGERTLLVHRGETHANYRVEDITPSHMTFVYLPLNEKQRLIFGTAN
jgi:hypothetical protein